MNKNIAESDYEGWVAYIDGNPVFERVPFLPSLAPVEAAAGGKELPFRGEARDVKEWKDLPAHQIEEIELYYAREHYPNQPVIRLTREPGHHHVRFFQMKMDGLVVNTANFATRGVNRLGIVGYKIGFWDPTRKDCQMWEITRNGIKHQKRESATAPAPRGFGIAKAAMGREPS